MSVYAPQIVDDEKRMEFAEKWFAGSTLDVVAASVADSMSPDYSGGFWRYYEDENNGLFFLIPPEGNYQVNVSGNGYQGTLSAYAFGLVATIFAINMMSWKAHELEHHQLGDFFADRQVVATDYAATLEEAGEIFSAID